MPQPIRQNSTDKVSIGPAVVIGDGFTLNTALLLSTADSAKAKLGDDSVVDISGYTWAATTSMDGEFDLTLQTGISDTVGPMTILIEDVSLVLPIREKFYVYDPLAFDTLYILNPTLLTARDLGLFHESTIGIVNSQLSFDMDVAIVTDDNWIGNVVTIHDVSTGEVVTKWIVDVDKLNDRIIIDSVPIFTVVVGDILRVKENIHPRFVINAFAPPTRVEATTDKTSTDDLVVAMAQLMGRKDANLTTDRAAAIALLNADEGSGAGAYSHLTDSQEAARDTLPASGLIDTTIATLATQISFTLTAGSPDDDAYNNCMIVITDAATATQKAVGWVKDYAQLTKTITLKKDPVVFTMAVGNKVVISAAKTDVEAWNSADSAGAGNSGNKWRGI